MSPEDSVIVYEVFITSVDHIQDTRAMNSTGTSWPSQQYTIERNVKGYDANVSMCVRQSALDNGLNYILLSVVKNWLKEYWSFDNPGFPERKIKWDKWNAL